MASQSTVAAPRPVWGSLTDQDLKTLQAAVNGSGAAGPGYGIEFDLRSRTELKVLRYEGQEGWKLEPRFALHWVHQPVMGRPGQFDSEVQVALLGPYDASTTAKILHQLAMHLSHLKFVYDPSNHVHFAHAQDVCEVLKKVHTEKCSHRWVHSPAVPSRLVCAPHVRR